MKQKGFKSQALSVFFLFLGLFPTGSSAQDLSVQDVTCYPSSIQAGESVHCQAEIKNIGPSMVLAAQYGWFLSPDTNLSIEDVMISDIQNLNQILYQGDAVTVDIDLSVPPFNDQDSYSYLGVVLDPYSILYDPNPENNSNACQVQIINPPNLVFDTKGDNDLDVTSVTAAIQDNHLLVDLTFARPLDACYGFMALDLDQDPGTGLPDITVPGAEAFLSIVIHEYLSILELTTAVGTRDITSFQVDGNTLRCLIPMDLLGHDVSMDLLWAVDSSPGMSADLDRVPDIGVYSTSTREVVVRRPGNTSIDVIIQDTEADEPEFPDITLVETKVMGDQLWISLVFSHQVDNLGVMPGS